MAGCWSSWLLADGWLAWLLIKLAGLAASQAGWLGCWLDGWLAGLVAVPRPRAGYRALALAGARLTSALSARSGQAWLPIRPGQATNSYLKVTISNNK